MTITEKGYCHDPVTGELDERHPGILSEHFGVGRPSVRQALFALDRMKLIEIRNGGRARVCVPTAEGLFEELAKPVRYMMNQPDWVAKFQGVQIFWCVRYGHADRAPHRY